MALHIGSIAPDFEQDSTEGRIKFHQWIGDKWCVLFSHPADFTPVCTTELGMVAKLKGDFDKRNCKVIALSVDPEANDTLTVRSVFIIDPKKKIRLILTYPASTGRNFAEILRVIDSLQLTDNHSVATPANWQDGGDCVIVPSLKDPEVMKQKFPKGWNEVRPYLRMTPQPNK
jgi:thioredoxin-dependent peroxiredoxin